MPIKLSYLFLLLLAFLHNTYASGHDESQARILQELHSDEIIRESRRLQSSMKENIRMLAFHRKQSRALF